MEQNKKSSGITTSRNFACSQSSYFSLQHTHAHTHKGVHTFHIFRHIYLQYHSHTLYAHTHTGTQKGVHTLHRFRHTCMPYHIHTLYAHTHTYTQKMCIYPTDPGTHILYTISYSPSSCTHTQPQRVCTCLTYHTHIYPIPYPHASCTHAQTHIIHTHTSLSTH